MNALEIFEAVIVLEAFTLMLYVLVKLWYYDSCIKKTFITKQIEMFLKYGLFKKGLFFSFVYFLSLFIHKIIYIRNPSSNIAYVFSITAGLSLICLSYTVFKISLKTYGRWKTPK